MFTLLLLTLVRATLYLAAAGTVFLLILRYVPCRSARLHRVVWCFVLLQGVIWFPVNVRIAILKPLPQNVAIEKHATQDAKTLSVENTAAEKSALENVALKNADFHAIQNETTSKQTPVSPSRFRWTNIQNVLVFTLLSVWICGIAVVMTRQIIAYCRALTYLRRAAAEISDEYQREWETLLAEYQIPVKKIRLILTDDFSPGLLKLPRGYAVAIPLPLWEESSEAVRRGILRHEISHYLRNDLTKSFLMRLIVIVHWFNPMASMAMRRFDDAAEWQCDAAAFGSCADGVSELAATLLAFYETVPVAAVYRRTFGGSNMKQRVSRLIEHRQKRGDSLMKRTSIFTAAIVSLCLGVTRFELTAKQFPNEESPKNSTVASQPASQNAEAKTAVADKAEKQPLIPRASVRGEVAYTEKQPEKSDESGESGPVPIKIIAQFPDGISAERCLVYTDGCGKVPEMRADGTTHYVSLSFGMGDRKLSEIQDSLPVAFHEFEGIMAIRDQKDEWAAPYQFLSFGKNPPESLTFQFSRGVKVEGTVSDEKNKPISNTKISIYCVSDEIRKDASQRELGFGHLVSWKTTTDKNGHYSFRVFPKGKYYVVVAPDKDLYSKLLIDLPPDEPYVKKVEFSDKDSLVYDFKIPPFWGRVLYSDGTVVPDCYVHMLPYYYQNPINNSSTFFASPETGIYVPTDKDGYFASPKRPKDNVFISILAESKNKKSHEGYIAWVEDKLENDATFQLRHCGKIEGRLLDAKTGEPLANQRVFYSYFNVNNSKQRCLFPHFEKTDENGNFTLEKGVLSGLCYRLFLVPSRKDDGVGGRYEPSIDIKTVIPKNDGETISLGEISVKMEEEQKRIPNNSNLPQRPQ